MPITIKTIYTKEKLLEAQRFFIRQKKVFWFIMALGTFFTLLSFAFLAAIDELSTTVWICAIGVVVIDLFYVFMYFIMPKLTVNKSPLLNSEVTFEFDWDHFNTTSSGRLMNGSSSVKYIALKRIKKVGKTVYLIDSSNRFYIVDLSESTCKDIAALRGIFENNFAEKNISWN